MKKRKWTAERKAPIVRSGPKGQSVPEICTERGIAQSEERRWRDPFLANAPAGRNGVHRLKQVRGLLVKPNLRLRVKHKADSHKPGPKRSGQWRGIDMITINGFGWVGVVIVTDWRSQTHLKQAA